MIAANKTDLIFNDGEAEDPVERLKKEFEPKGMKVFSISGATGAGIKELLYYVSEELSKVDDKPIVFEQEYFPDEELIYIDLPYTVEKEDDMYVVEGPKIEKMLGYTNLGFLPLPVHPKFLYLSRISGRMQIPSLNQRTSLLCI